MGGSRKRDPKSYSPASTSIDSRNIKNARKIDSPSSNRVNIKNIKKSRFVYAWLNSSIENGYIFHPKAGWIIHPSFYDEDGPLCHAKSICTHQRDCKEVRMRMAVYQYIRAEERNMPLSYREVELLWGVSHSTVQRRKLVMESKSDIFFLMTPFKKFECT